MLRAIGEILPAALAIALSPFPVIALVVADTASIAEVGLDGSQAMIATGVFVLLVSSTVLGTVAVRWILGERAARPLASLQQFMLQNNAIIMMMVLLLLGAKILGEGLAGLGR